MGDLKVLWRNVLAPQLKAQKAALGRRVPERQIAFEIEQATGQASSRSLLAMWLSGEREPTVSQFIALCRRLMLDPMDVLSGRVYHRPESGALTHAPERQFVKARNKSDVSLSKRASGGVIKAHKVSHRR